MKTLASSSLIAWIISSTREVMWKQFEICWSPWRGSPRRLAGIAPDRMPAKICRFIDATREPFVPQYSAFRFQE